MQRINNNILISSIRKFFCSGTFFTFATFSSHLNWFPPLTRSFLEIISTKLIPTFYAIFIFSIVRRNMESIFGTKSGTHFKRCLSHPFASSYWSSGELSNLQSTIYWLSSFQTWYNFSLRSYLHGTLFRQNIWAD